MIARYAISIGLGAGVTFGLLFLMQLLIATGRGALTESSTFRSSISFGLSATKSSRPKRISPRNRRSRKRPRRSDRLIRRTISITRWRCRCRLHRRTNLNVGGVGFGVSDGEYLPIVKVAPVYPSRALSRGLEGFVIVEFTVTRQGTVRDPVVVESTSSCLSVLRPKRR